jgi:hypothetical protein
VIQVIQLTFTIQLPDDVAQQLQSQAAQLNVSPDVLVAQWVTKELAPASPQSTSNAIASRYPQGVAPDTTIDDLTVTRDLADLLIRLRQAHSTGATTATLPATSVTLDFLQILQTLGFINQIQSNSGLEVVHVTLTSTGDRSILEAIERLSLLQAETDLEHSPDLTDWITHLRNPDPAIREKAVSVLGASYGESNQ